MLRIIHIETSMSIEQLEKYIQTNKDIALNVANVNLSITQARKKLYELERKLAGYKKSLLPRYLKKNGISPDVKANYQQQLDVCNQLYPNTDDFSYLDTSNLKEKLETTRIDILRAREQVQIQEDKQPPLQTTEEELKNNRLIQDPLELIQELSKAMIVAFRQFEIDFPAKQSIIIRQCLDRVEEKITVIKDGCIPNGSRIRTDASIRTDYYKLYGMLAKFKQLLLLEKVEHSLLPTHQAFRKLIESLLLKVSINSSRELFINQDECRIKFEQLMATDQTLFHQMTESKFNEIELLNYSIACKKLRDKKIVVNWQESSKICPKIDNVLLEIEKAIAMLEPAEKQPLLKFLTTLVQNTDKVVTYTLLEKHSPDQKAAQLRNYQSLIALYEKGAPSICKKILGAMAILLGALLILAKLSVKIISLGALTPITSCGILAGSTLILLGTGLFNHGMRKDPSKALVQLGDKLDTEIKNCREKVARRV